jgi:VanZ family protein
LNKARRSAIAWLPAIAYMALIWTLSSFSTLPSIADIPFQDKGAHFIEYAVLGFFYSHAFTSYFPQWPRRRIFFIAVLLATSWGALDECHQAFVPGRDASLLDVCADALGALLGTGLYPILSSAAKRFLRIRA